MFCTNCGAQLEEQVRFCEHCGSPRPSRPVPQSFATAIAQTEFKHCTACGQQTRVAATVCDRCGATQFLAASAVLDSIGSYEGLASIGARLVACFIDHVLAFVVYALLAAILGDSGITWTLFFLAPIAYFIIGEGIWDRTPGKVLLGIKIIDAAGGSISWRQAAGRNLLRVIDYFAYIVPLVGPILMATSASKQRLGDRAAKTLVVKT